jgi:Do/DeqQ family serine protease
MRWTGLKGTAWLVAAVLAVLSFAGGEAVGQGQEEAAAGDATTIDSLLDNLFGRDSPADDGDAVRGGSTQEVVPQSRRQIQLSFAPLVKQTAPAVVNVYADRLIEHRSPFAGDPFFERFFGQQMPHRTERQSSLGSGVVIDPSGIVITNHHVIEGSDEIRVAFSDGREYDCEVILTDETVDLAVLEIQADEDETFRSVPLGDSDALEVGDLVLAIGNPFGVGQTVTSGIVSALARNQIGISDFGFFIQTDAAINPGNSGGPLINMDGELVGINTAIYSRSGGSNGIGFAIPANMVRAVVAAAETGTGRFVRPYIGATFEPVTPAIAEALGTPGVAGALVNDVVEGGPAADAGLQPGDIVIAVNGRNVQHPDALGYRLATAGVGETASLDVFSRGETREVKITLEPPPEVEELVVEGDNPFSGAVVADLTPFLGEQLQLRNSDNGVVVLDVHGRSPAARFGLRPGDVITSVNGETIDSTERLTAVLDQGAGLWRFDIDRGGRTLRQFVR